MRTSLLLAAGLLLPVLATPVRAQERASSPQFQALLSGKGAPLTMKLKELTPQWQRVNVSGEAAAGGAGASALASGLFGAMLGGGAGPSSVKPGLYTQGGTFTVGTETYLITYKAEVKSLDFMALMRAGQGAQLPLPEKLSGESLVHLNLLNVRHIAAISDIRPFDLARELAESEKSAKEEGEFREQIMRGGPFGGGAAAPAAAPVFEDAQLRPDVAAPAAPPKQPVKPGAKSKAAPRKR